MKLRVIIFGAAVVCMAMAMSSPLWAAHTDGGCAGCHAAHSAGEPNVPFSQVDVPLWKGILAPTSGFTPYSSGTMQAADVGDPDGDSLMCLSCHDGTTQDPATTNIDAEARLDLGRDLRDDHPISFVYTAALPAGDAGLRNPESYSPPALAGTIDAEMLDSNNKIQCTSCHDVHAQHTDMALIIPNPAGELCKACHIK